MSQRQGSRVFGKAQKQSHTIIFASGERVRHITIRPWVAGVCMSLLGVMAIGYLAATSYLVLRDDLVGASMARQAQMQYAYEDRIAALRSQIDRVTSRQLLDQQSMEEKVAELIARQEALTNRQGQLGPLLDRVGIAQDEIPVPGENPKRRAALQAENGKMPRLAALASRPDVLANPAFGKFDPLGYAVRDRLAGVDPRGGETVRERADRIFSTVTSSLKSIEREQIEKMQDLAINAFETTSEIGDVIRSAGLPVPDSENSAVGGPFVRPNDPNAFQTTLEDLDQALGRLEAMRLHALTLPISNPVAKTQITSRFGNRKDPFLGKPGFHGGLDFRAPTGTPIFSGGSGVVVSAGRSGGYGKLIEIDHGNGITTRYAHLSEVQVKTGDIVSGGTRIGEAGSTGRSTGPHLHYEIRRNGKPIDPMPFLKTAKILQPLMVSN